VASASNTSVTQVVEVKKGLDWFDHEGKMTLIDCPGLADSDNKDQQILDDMAEELKKILQIDIFVLMMSGDRLGNAALMECMKVYEVLCGGRMVWNNIILAIPKQDYNPALYDDIEDWEGALVKKE